MNYICYILVVALLAILFQINETDASSTCNSYEHRNPCGLFGWARCPETKCHASGQFTCTCPGNGLSVSYRIACHRSGGSCVPSNAGRTCDKYINCAVCHTSAGEFEGGCLLCRAGFALTGGLCNEDVNECQQHRPCEHQCVNTFGSYTCLCHQGYILRPNGRCEDIDECLRNPCQHTCNNTPGSYQCSCHQGYSLQPGGRCIDIDECLRNPCQHTCTNTPGSYRCSCHQGHHLQSGGRCIGVECGRPPNVVNGDIIPVTSYTFNNYSQYSCNNGLLLHGNAVRKCLADSNWAGSNPTCLDTCALTAFTPRHQCGPPSVSQSECLQLGCCFSSRHGQSNCYFRQEIEWMTNRGERALGPAFQTFQEYSTRGCGYSCLTTPSCKTFVVQRQPSDTVHHQTCQLFDKSRFQLNISFGDHTYDLHEPVASNSRGADDQDRLYSIFVGCYDVSGTNKRVSVYRVWSSVNNSPARCVTACRQQGYTLAELQDGEHCYCGDEEPVDLTSYNSSNCLKSCSGRPGETCGGTNSRSIYRVPADERYIGCFGFVSGSVDFPLHLWTRPGRTSASDCIAGCLQRDNNYAAVHDGQHCYCGNSFVNHREQPYSECREKCSERTHEDCGGPSTQAVYATGLDDNGRLSPTPTNGHRFRAPSLP